MKIEIIGNPGSGNTFGETVIQHADVVAPNATTVSPTYNYYGNAKNPQKKSAEQADEELKNVYKKEILDYVGKLSPYVSDGWVKTYDTMWLAILKLPSVEEEIFEVGNQHDTNFNRNLVASIIWVMVTQDVLKEKVKTALAEILEGNKKHSVRLAMNFPDDDMTKAIKEIIENEKRK